ncbi:MAG: YiiX/YebB-like N1pC/P60 family cysteine hydrolase [Candidatus Falkowbacteria bacterium]
MKKNTQNKIITKRFWLINSSKHYIVLALASVFVAMIFVGFRIFYPFYYLFVLIFSFIAVRFLFKAIMLKQGKIARSKPFLMLINFWRTKKFLAILLIGIVFFGFLALAVVPWGASPFLGKSKEQIKTMVTDDTWRAVVLLDNLKTVGEDFVTDPILNQKEFTADQNAQVKQEWNRFLLAVAETERLTEVHKYFNQINFFTNREENNKSFMIAYALYMKKYELYHKLISTIHDNEAVVKILNEYSPIYNGKNAYNDTMSMFFDSQSLVRRNLGRFNLFIIGLFDNDLAWGEDYILLKRESANSNAYLLGQLDTQAINMLKVAGRSYENKLFGAWFPIQKNVANVMGNIYVSQRHEKLITTEQIDEMVKQLEPGDILVERRNWYASNVGIPGFWPHAAIYFGGYSALLDYFKAVPLEKYASLDELLKIEYPKLYETIIIKDKAGLEYSVIEGMAPGVIVQPLNVSAHADYVGVMRPRLTKADKLKAILRAFGNFGKPYDYNFDFETKDELVCSELVYDAFLQTKEKKGINFPLHLVSGRKMVSPTDFVQKFSEERKKSNSELDFVYFLDGNEKAGNAMVKNENDFAASWKRLKYDFAQE